jgi:hypothetical protein
VAAPFRPARLLLLRRTLWRPSPTRPALLLLLLLLTLRRPSPTRSTLLRRLGLGRSRGGLLASPS